MSDWDSSKALVPVPRKWWRPDGGLSCLAVAAAFLIRALLGRVLLGIVLFSYALRLWRLRLRAVSLPGLIFLLLTFAFRPQACMEVGLVLVVEKYL